MAVNRIQRARDILLRAGIDLNSEGIRRVYKQAGHDLDYILDAYEQLKDGPVDKCTCMCHTSPYAVMHVMACCDPSSAKPFSSLLNPPKVEHPPIDEEWVFKQMHRFFEVHADKFAPFFEPMKESPPARIKQQEIGRGLRPAPKGLVVLNLAEVEQIRDFMKAKTEELGPNAKFAINEGEPNGIGPVFKVTAEDGTTQTISDIDSW